MVALIVRLPTFCHPFFSKETRKLTASMTFPINSSSVIPTFPTATARHKTFFNWNLMVDLIPLALAFKSSAWKTGEGNLPAVSYG